MNLKQNNDFWHDLQCGLFGENMVGSLLQADLSRIEVKTDFMAHETGNLYIEFMNGSKLSGLSTTKSDFYCFLIPQNNVMVMMPTEKLKEVAKRYYKATKKRKNGGDGKRAKGIALPFGEIIK